ncbi:hypothetical protein L1987_30727 [Smallanthus sonchifolius]|uniref:Uncharacterized protein n=1 Tax=Smallanthus sonchifolius TaxID=185202 RepID=A0ACB9I3J3_9ASTR|nr:hypothetical protein L1987_30727 [Smallanthus sonchifolius]
MIRYSLSVGFISFSVDTEAEDSIDMQNGDSDSSSSEEDGHASAILLGSSIAVKNDVRPYQASRSEEIISLHHMDFLG